MKKSILILSLLFAGVSAHANVVCKSGDSELVSWAESNKAEAERRFAVGLVAITDVQESIAYAYEVKYCTGAISKETFCKEGRTALKNRLEAVEAGYEVGTRTMSDKMSARSALAYAEKVCN
jgi:hypothetical protein